MDNARLEREIENRINEAADVFVMGQVSSVVGSQLNVQLAGSTLTIPRLATWTPAAGDIVLVAKTRAGYVAIGKVQP